MKYLLLLALCSSSYSMTFQHAREIYNKIIHANNISAPPLVLVNDTRPNAHETEDEIAVNSGMLKFVRNDAELAFTIGHEIAHYTLHHSVSNKANEYAADKQGAYYMMAAGYNRCVGAQLMKRFHSGDSLTHPRDGDRVKALGCK